MKQEEIISDLIKGKLRELSKDELIEIITNLTSKYMFARIFRSFDNELKISNCLQQLDAKIPEIVNNLEELLNHEGINSKFCINLNTTLFRNEDK